MLSNKDHLNTCKIQLKLLCICLQSFRGAARLAYGQHPEMEVKATESTNEKQHNENILPEASELPATITSNGQRRSLKNDVRINI